MKVARRPGRVVRVTQARDCSFDGAGVACCWSTGLGQGCAPGAGHLIRAVSMQALRGPERGLTRRHPATRALPDVLVIRDRPFGDRGHERAPAGACDLFGPDRPRHRDPSRLVALACTSNCMEPSSSCEGPRPWTLPRHRLARSGRSRAGPRIFHALLRRRTPFRAAPRSPRRAELPFGQASGSA